MLEVMNKDTRLNLRITPQFREQIEALADYHGLTMSSYVHSLLVKAIRHEVTETKGNKIVTLDTNSGRIIRIEPEGELTDEKRKKRRA